MLKNIYDKAERLQTVIKMATKRIKKCDRLLKDIKEGRKLTAVHLSSLSDRTLFETFEGSDLWDFIQEEGLIKDLEQSSWSETLPEMILKDMRERGQLLLKRSQKAFDELGKDKKECKKCISGGSRCKKCHNEIKEKGKDCHIASEHIRDFPPFKFSARKLWENHTNRAMVAMPANFEAGTEEDPNLYKFKRVPYSNGHEAILVGKSSEVRPAKDNRIKFSDIFDTAFMDAKQKERERVFNQKCDQFSKMCDEVTADLKQQREKALEQVFMDGFKKQALTDMVRQLGTARKAVRGIRTCIDMCLTEPSVKMLAKDLAAKDREVAIMEMILEKDHSITVKGGL